ncbi:MAG: hypothetical protein K2O69_04780, partial [Odoribacter sp.]|nr:hypothetical protein [Odoribacter sp.]
MHSIKIFLYTLLFLYGGQVFPQGTASGHKKGVLYNGVCWAESNVDKPGTFAASPRDYGMLYQWNSKKGWLATESIFDRDKQTSVVKQWESANDPCPAGWRIPTIEEINFDRCENWMCGLNLATNIINYHHKHGSDTLTFPTFGPKNIGYNPTVATSTQGYWSSSSDTDDNSKVWMFLHSRCGWGTVNFLVPHDYAFYIRCVAEKHDTVIDVFETISAEDLPHKWGDTIFQVGTKTGIYRFQQNSCAFTNIIDLHLTVKTPEISFSDAICYGSSYDKNGFRLPAVYADTVVHDTLRSVSGCDTIRTLILAVHPVPQFYFEDEVCYGNSYDNYGFHLPAVYADTVVRHSFKTRWGCDSTRTLVLTVHPVRDTTVYDSVCQGDSY